VDEAVALEAGDGVVDGGGGDAQAVGEVDDAGLAGGVDQVGDQLDVVLGDLAAVVVARAAEAGRLLGRPDETR
jgi:hypothetical protein